MLKKLQSLAWYLQLAIFSGIALLIFGCFWNFVTSSMRADTKELEDQIAVLKQQNEAARIASQRINEFRADYQRKQEEYEELKALLPEQREITNVLQNLQDRARATNLSLRRFTPKDDFQKDFCSGKPVEVEVTSTFANLRSFYEELAKMQRIVSITDFNIKQSPDQTVNKTIDAQFLLTAYYVSPQQLQQGKPTAPQQAPGTQQPAAPAPAK